MWVGSVQQRNWETCNVCFDYKPLPTTSSNKKSELSSDKSNLATGNNPVLKRQKGVLAPMELRSGKWIFLLRNIAKIINTDYEIWNVHGPVQVIIAHNYTKLQQLGSLIWGEKATVCVTALAKVIIPHTAKGYGEQAYIKTGLRDMVGLEMAQRKSCPILSWTQGFSLAVRYKLEFFSLRKTSAAMWAGTITKMWSFYAKQIRPKLVSFSPTHML